MAARIERVVTFGVIGVGRPGLPPEGIELDNNVWIVGDDEQVLIIDAAHDADAIVQAVGEREVLGLLLTHGHEDHINVAVATAQALDTHIYLHPSDLFLWQETYSETLPDFELTDGASFMVAGTDITTVHTPGHTPGSVCFVAAGIDTVFSGDTLFQGGPGATRWDYSSFPQIVESIRTRLFALPQMTAVNPGHGGSTSIADEQPALEEWLARGW
ncbi:MBL fold metallo-hydrolase [Leucobacter coleopterorum]|uniref:MBL fold metallo-hydrolase n=1 Tax=Leucobacter coleopterorum TaxID=2714933 RepID=A0ABX6JW83_9MICO|nr:MBL fold metallo-hydrolase [Leucobacter coleopterorum]QIM18498.1 MBL fold metallo-hydrolase [Leucobacter coleopterorum]